MINGSRQKINEGFQAQVLTFLISSKEKILEFVYTMNKNKNNINDLFPEEIKDMNNRFQKLNQFIKAANDLKNKIGTLFNTIKKLENDNNELNDKTNNIITNVSNLSSIYNNLSKNKQK